MQIASFYKLYFLNYNQHCTHEQISLTTLTFHFLPNHFKSILAYCYPFKEFNKHEFISFDRIAKPNTNGIL